MKPVMASLKALYGDKVQWHYHEFNSADAVQVNKDFGIVAHPEIFLLDRRGNLVKKFAGVASAYEIETTLRPLLP